jgi:uncharacterized protein YecE (DUF72 family)
VYPDPPPPRFDRLAYLSRYFTTIEVNSTFYRPFPEDVAARWAGRVEKRADFRFGVKLWRRFTHEREAAWTAEDVKAARAVPDRLAREGRLGAVLLQFPWSFKRSDAEEEWLLGLFGAFSGLPLVVEVRHASWDTPDFLAELADEGVGFVNVDQPLFRRSIRPSAVTTSPVGYIRVHGRNWKDWFRKGAGRDARYDYLYTAAELAPWAQRAKAMSASRASPPDAVPNAVPEIFVVTNNHFQGKAVANAAMLESMIEDRKVEVPPELRRTYEDALRAFTKP